MMKISGIRDWFNPSPEAQENMAREARRHAINTAVMSLLEIEDPEIQQIVAQLRILQNG